MLSHKSNSTLTDICTGPGNRMVGPPDDEEFGVAPSRLQACMQFAGVSQRYNNVIVTVDQQDGRIIVCGKADWRNVRFGSGRHFCCGCTWLITQQLPVCRVFMLDLRQQ